MQEMLSFHRATRRHGFTMFEIAVTLVVGGVLFILLSAISSGALSRGRLEVPKRALTTFVAEQQARYDLSSEWLTPGTAAVGDVVVVDAATESVDARTVSMATDTVDGFERLSAAASDGYGSCLIWRSFESGAPTQDVQLIINDAPCTGASAMAATGGSAW